MIDIKRLRYAVKGRLFELPYAIRDGQHNRRWQTAETRFVIARHSGKSPYFHDYFLQWLSESVPDVRTRFVLRLLPLRSIDWSKVSAFSAWLQDPAVDWLPRGALTRVLDLQQQCRERGIAVINPVEALSNAVKSVGARLIASTGVRTPRVQSIADPKAYAASEPPFPVLIREDRHHGRPSFRVHHLDQLQVVNWRRFEHPIAAEFIDVQSPVDGLYRKYRYLAAGEIGVPRHLIVSRHWEVRACQRVRSETTRREEIEYLSRPDPNHEQLQTIRRAMGLDLVAFDYSYDSDGRLVVWEANPYPNLSQPAGGGVEYTRPFVERSYAAIAAMYLNAAGLEVPETLIRILGDYARASGDSPTELSLAKAA